MAKERKSLEDLAEERRAHKISEELEDLVEPVERLTPHPRNARRSDVRRLAESLVRFGQVRPILATREGVIVAGNHVYRAATEVLGWDQIAVVRAEMDDDDAEAYLLADNRLADISGYDDEGLAELLRSIGPAGLYATGYPEDEDELNSLLRRLEPDGPEQEFELSGDPATYRCPNCGHEWNGRPRPRPDF